ncbi:MAG: HAD family phosphatase [Clostridia bacterium]
MAFIFDLDGTLIDSMQVWKTIGSTYLKNRGITPEDDVDKRIVTYSQEEVAEHFIETYNIQDDKEFLMEDIFNFVKELLRNNAPPKDGILEFLEANRDKKMCIATASDRILTEMSLKTHGMEHYFSEIFTCIEVGAGKDKADIYEIALEHLGTKKEETYVFEDALHAMKTAKNANFRVIGIYDLSAEKDTEEIKQLTDIYIENYSELLTIIK